MSPHRDDRPRSRLDADGNQLDEGVADVLPTIFVNEADVAAAEELAEAERAVARRGATPAQSQGVDAAARTRRAEDRVAAWRSEQHPPSPENQPR